MEITTRKDHWETVFANKQENEVSWFQPYPKTSIEFIELFNIPLYANIIDIGGGDKQIATSKKVKTIKSQIVEKMEQVYDFGLEFPSLAQRKLRRVIRFVEGEL